MFIFAYMKYMSYIYAVNEKNMAAERKYKIMGAGSGLYVWNVETSEKVYRGRSYADCRNKLYELMGWRTPKHWKF